MHSYLFLIESVGSHVSLLGHKMRRPSLALPPPNLIDTTQSLRRLSVVHKSQLRPR